MKDWAAKNKWKFIGALVIFILLAAAYGGGRYAQPARVVEKEKVVTKVQLQDHVVYQDRIQIEKVFVEVEKKAVHKETTSTKSPDGTVVTKVVEDAKVDTSEKSDTSKVEVKYVDRIVEKVVTQVVEKEKIIEAAKPNWRVGPMIGVDVRTVLGQYAQPISALGPVVIGVQGERRLWGPLSVGAWGMTSGELGVLATLEW